MHLYFNALYIVNSYYLQESSDFIFDDKNPQEISTEKKLQSTSSHQNSHQNTVPLVDYSNQEDEDDSSEDTFFGKIGQHIQRFKRDLLSDVANFFKFEDQKSSFTAL